MKENKNKKIKRIAIIGLGLIGGSLAKVLKNKYEIVGVSKSKSTIQKALKQKIINKGYIDLNKNTLSGVDLIFICTPLSLITQKIKELSKVLDHEVIVTDVGSTKSEICNFARKSLPSNITFIGGHPMAGNEFSGIEYADKELFKNTAWILTPIKNHKSSIKKLESVIKVTRAKVLISNPKEHDEAVALISHLPILLSSSLCKLLLGIKNKKLKTLAEKLASSGFRDTTRIAGGNPQLNFDLIASNKTQISKFLPSYINEIKKLSGLKNNALIELTKITNWRKKLYNGNGKNINLL